MPSNLIKAFRQGILNVIPKCDRAWVRKQFQQQDKRAKRRKIEDKQRAAKIQKMMDKITKEIDEKESKSV